MMRLILIRHGETDDNSQNRYCGFRDPSLNNKGIYQARCLAARLRDVGIDKVYSSDLNRAYETARIIFENQFIEKMVEFREINFGIFEGLTHEEIIRRYPAIYRQWLDDLKSVKIPEGESLSDLNKRVKEKLSFILSQHRNRTIALVAHGGPIKIILCHALRYDLENFWQIEQESCALNIIDYSNGRLPVVVRMNDTSHLLDKG